MPEQYGASTSNVTILYVNIRSLRCNFDELCALIDTFSDRPDIVALTDTWLTENIR